MTKRNIVAIVRLLFNGLFLIVNRAPRGLAPFPTRLARPGARQAVTTPVRVTASETAEQMKQALIQ